MRKFIQWVVLIQSTLWWAVYGEEWVQKEGGPPVLIPDWPVRPLYIEEHNINYYAVEMGIRSTWCINTTYSGQLLLELDKIIYDQT